MSDLAIKVSGLGKQYRLGGRKQPYRTLRESLSQTLTAPFRRRVADDTSSFWALKDVDFEIHPGEVVGIIGRNGAGKSTLLKILSRITDPTEGEIDINGRVGSLLEVGTGFHPELSGRENVYLNGAILGMKRADITKKFDEIVAFAETEKFLDTPVKYYSSGMYTRLAFAVAAHLDPEILIVDEVLAVGDISFQKKCMGKMGAVASQGRTVLFVSHNLTAIRTLCKTAVVLKSGRVWMHGTADECVQQFLNEEQPGGAEIVTRFDRPPVNGPYMTRAWVAVDGRPTASVPMGSRVTLEVDWSADQPIAAPRLGFVVKSSGGESLLNANNHYQPGVDLKEPTAAGTLRCDLGMLPLMPGKYGFSLWFGDEDRNTHVVADTVPFAVVEHDVWGGGKFPPSSISHFWWPTRFEAGVDAARVAVPSGELATS